MLEPKVVPIATPNTIEVTIFLENVYEALENGNTVRLELFEHEHGEVTERPFSSYNLKLRKVKERFTENSFIDVTGSKCVY